MPPKRPSRRSGKRRKQREDGARRPDAPALPAQIEALLRTAEESLAARDYKQAAQIAGEVLRRDDSILRANRVMAHALTIQSHHEEAIRYLTNVCATNEATFDERRLLADTYREIGQTGQAAAHYKALLKIDPRFVHAINELGLIALDAGDLEKAERRFRKAMALDPAFPGVCLNLARSRRFKPEADDLALEKTMLKVASRTDLVPEARADTRFALAKVRADCKDYERAFEHLAEANALMKSVLHFDREQHDATIDRIIETFTPELFARKAGYGQPSERPVFIVGMPRSGTTLVEQILSAHPAVHGAGELPTLDAVAAGLARRLGAQVTYPRVVTELTESVALESGKAYLDSLMALDEEALRVTDKLPTNFAHLGLAALVLPGAKVIHCRRHPMAMGLSIFEQQFATGHDWAYDLDDIGFFYRAYERLMAHWREVLPLPLLEISYEELVGDQERLSRELVAFCGLAWDPACLEFHAVERKVETASNWQVRQPLYARSVERWRRYGEALAPLREALGDLPADAVA